MNWMGIRKKIWHAGAQSHDGRIETELPPPPRSSKIIGAASPYFVKKFGLNPAAQILVWSGDNRAAMIGLGLIREGMVPFSLAQATPVRLR